MKHNKIRKGIVLSLSLFLLLTGCTDKITQEAKKQQVKQHKTAKQKESKKTKEEKQQKETYDKISKPMDQVMDESEKDQKQIIDKQFIIKDNYTDPNELEKFVAKNVFDFYSLNMTPEDYYLFLKKYGSKKITEKEKVLSDKKSGVLFLTNIQGLLKDKGARGIDYSLSEITLNNGKTEAYFYRKVQLASRKYEYFITTLVKENDVWKFEEDSPSAPFDEIAPKENTND